MVEAGGDITAAAIWTSAGPALTVWPNDSSCYEPDTSSRLTVRHGATTGGPVDVVGMVAGVETTVISGLAEGAQETVDLPGGLAVTDAAVVLAGTDTVAIALGDLTFDAGSQYVVYAGGGNDGPAGVFVDVIPMDPCEVPVEPTTTTTTRSGTSRSGDGGPCVHRLISGSAGPDVVPGARPCGGHRRVWSTTPGRTRHDPDHRVGVGRRESGGQFVTGSPSRTASMRSPASSIVVSHDTASSLTRMWRALPSIAFSALDSLELRSRSDRFRTTSAHS